MLYCSESWLKLPIVLLIVLLVFISAVIAALFFTATVATTASNKNAFFALLFEPFGSASASATGFAERTTHDCPLTRLTTLRHKAII